MGAACEACAGGLRLAPRYIVDRRPGMQIVAVIPIRAAGPGFCGMIGGEKAGAA